MLACDYCLKLLIYAKFANILTINVLTNYYFPMQNVRPAYIQLITGFGLKWGEKMTNTDKQWQIIIKSSGALIRV